MQEERGTAANRRMSHRRRILSAACRLAAIVLLTSVPPVRSGAAPAETEPRQTFEIAKPPDWVVPVPPELESKPHDARNTLGEYYLLVDAQQNAQSQESYHHIARLFLNSSGVQNGAQVKLQFDPSYQQLIIHSIVIHRGAETLDRLDAKKIKVIQQERELERHVYNGTYSAVLFLEDLRPGDCVEYAFSIRGANPILNGHFADSFLAGWPVPLHRQFYRLLWQSNRELHITNHGADCRPVIKTGDHGKEYLWDFKDMPAITAEDSLPVWYEVYPWVQVSDFNSWREVALWAEAM
jgi:hypothetical protein